MSADTIRKRIEAHAAACRDAVAEGRPRPHWVDRLGDISLRGADIRGADLRAAHISGADLRGADLRGATVSEGVVAAAVAGVDDDYCWHALRLNDGAVILQYGCDRAPLTEWLQRGPDYGARHGEPPEHWERGPAVAIAAAVALRDGGGR